MAFVTILAAPAAAHADPGAAAVARAGAVVVGGDDATAIARNPAGLARRSSLRLTLGLSLDQRSVTYGSAESFAAPPPNVEDASDVAIRPWGGAAFGLGDRIVLGAAILAPTTVDFTDPVPAQAYDAAHDDREAALGRYAGSHLAMSRWAGGVGAAVRLLPWMAVGAGVLAVRTRVEAARTIWAGPSPATRVADLSPDYDVLVLAAADGWSPMASAGVVVAPPDLPLELAASVVWRGATSLRGMTAPATSRGAGPTSTPLAALAGGTATLDLDAETVLRAGVRILGPRLSAELDGELDLRGTATPAFALGGVAVTRPNGEPAPLSSLALGPTFAESFALRGAVDVQIVPGTLALVGGYAVSGAAASATSVTPVAPFTMTQTIAGGVEMRVDTARVTLGLAHDFRADRTNSPGDARVVAPFVTLDVPAAAGRTSGGATTVALDVELELL